MRPYIERAIAWLERASKREPVPGWLTQGLLLVGWGVAWWAGHRTEAVVFLTGSMVVGVIRQIERSKR